MALKLHIREIRESRGLSGADLAEMVGVSGAHLSEVERGLKRIHGDLLDRIAIALGVQPQALISGGDDDGCKAKLNVAISDMDEADVERVLRFAEALKTSGPSQQNE